MDVELVPCMLTNDFKASLPGEIDAYTAPVADVLAAALSADPGSGEAVTVANALDNRYYDFVDVLDFQEHFKSRHLRFYFDWRTGEMVFSKPSLEASGSRRKFKVRMVHASCIAWGKVAVSEGPFTHVSTAFSIEQACS